MPSYQNKVNLEDIEAKSLFKKHKKKITSSYRFSRFALNDTHFKCLDCKGKSKKSWLDGEIIAAYLEINAPENVFVLEDIDTLKIFSLKHHPSSKVILLNLVYSILLFF